MNASTEVKSMGAEQPEATANSTAQYSYDALRKCYWRGKKIVSASEVCSALCERDAMRARIAELVGTLCSISATAAHTSGRFTDHPAKNALDAIRHTAQAALAK